MHFDELLSWIDAVHFAAAIEPDTDKYSIASHEMYTVSLEKNSSRRLHLFVQGENSSCPFYSITSVAAWREVMCYVFVEKSPCNSELSCKL